MRYILQSYYDNDTNAAHEKFMLFIAKVRYRNKWFK